MDEEKLLDQLDFAQARIEEIEKKVINWEPEKRGFKELVDSYNKWIDRYNELLETIQHIDDVDVEREKLELERVRIENEKAKIELEKEKTNSMIEVEKKKIEVDQARIAFEKEKFESMQEIEQDKVNLDTERLRLEREKFGHDVVAETRGEIIEVIFRSADIGVKLLVPTLAIAGTWAVAKLSYMNDADLKLCNGRVAGNVKELLRIATMKTV